MVSAGETVYQGLCAACHGFNARGIQGLGKTLIDSEFVNSLSDDELHAFMLVGRAVNDPLNTTGMVMPAKGGNPSLTDEDMYNVIAYIRSLNGAQTSVAAEPTAVPTESGPRPTATEFVAPSLSNLLGGADETEEATVEVTLEATEIAAVATASQSSSSSTTFMSAGQSDYVRSCAGCHGINGEGIPYIGPSLINNELVLEHDGMAIINLLTALHPPIDPRIAYPHPYRGGYPELTDRQISDIVTYLYLLTQ
jgi:mono/diheme cytochrome c family protein